MGDRQRRLYERLTTGDRNQRGFSEVCWGLGDSESEMECNQFGALRFVGLGGSHGKLGFGVTRGGRKNSVCQGLEMGVGLHLEYYAGGAGNLRGCLEGYRNGNSCVWGSDGSLNLG